MMAMTTRSSMRVNAGLQVNLLSGPKLMSVSNCRHGPFIKSNAYSFMCFTRYKIKINRATDQSSDLSRPVLIRTHNRTLQYLLATFPRWLCCRRGTPHNQWIQQQRTPGWRTRASRGRGSRPTRWHCKGQTSAGWLAALVAVKKRSRPQRTPRTNQQTRASRCSF